MELYLSNYVITSTKIIARLHFNKYYLKIPLYFLFSNFIIREREREGGKMSLLNFFREGKKNDGEFSKTKNKLERVRTF